MHANLTRRAAIQWSGAAFALPVVQSQPAYLENGMPFTPKFVDLARNFTAVQGIGPVVLGAAVSGFTSLGAALSAGDQFYYCIQGVDKPQEREVGRGTMQADGKIGRAAVVGDLTHFSSGTKTIALVTAAEWFTRVNEAGASIEAASRSALASAPSNRGPVMLTERGREGLFVWDATDLSARVAADTQQGLHVAPAGDPTGASGAWVRRFDGPVNATWFGLVEGDSSGANGAANSAAVTAMLAALRARAVNPALFYQGGETIRFPTGFYELAETIELTDGTFIVEGADTGFPAGRGTILKFPSGVTGIRIQRYNTSGATSVDEPTHRGGDGAILRNLALRGAHTGAEAEAHGIHLRARAVIENVFIDHFEGDGIYGLTDNANGNDNTNCTRIIGGSVRSCRNGLFIDGDDSNIWTVTGLDVSANRQWGIWDSSFLGNTFVGCHAATNGWNSEVAIPTACTYSGNRYYVRPGQAAAASTSAPSGTSAFNTWWGYIGAGGTFHGIADWASGSQFREGGSYKTDAANGQSAFLGCYTEGDQNPAQIRAPSIIVGGNLANINAHGSAPMFGADTGGNVQLGKRSGPPSDFTLSLDNTKLSSTIRFGKHNSAGIRTDEAAIWTASEMLIIDHLTSTRFRIAGIEKALITSTQVRPTTDNAMLLGSTSWRWQTVFGYTGDFATQVNVGGIKVLGERGAAVADASDSASAITQLNALLARLRAHGLIAN